MTPAYGELLRVFGRIGILSFGGPAAQISLMHRELVEERLWLDEQTFLRALSLCMLLPGPEAMQLATYAGWRLRGVAGGLVAGGLFVLPGAAVIAALVGLYATFGTVPVVQSAFLGVKATVIIIVLQALLKLSGKALAGSKSYLIAAFAFLAIFAFGLPYPLIVLVAALWGFVTAAPKTASCTPPLSTRPRPLPTAALWLTLWLAPLIALTLCGQELLSDLGWFFARLAVVTFGGAYAVLAYMAQTVVDQNQWITTEQMIDALGLAETTPGPLILVTQFVAMLTGQIAGGAGLAIAAGAVSLWATFVPCFLWIFLAGPYLEQISARPRLSSAMHDISAAVVGVILNLSLWFALNVLFGSVERWSLGVLTLPLPELNSIDLLAAGFVALASVLIFKAKIGMGCSLAMMAAIGAISHFL